MLKKSIALCCAIIVHLNSNKFDSLYYVCDSLMKDYFYKPPINQLSLTFLDKSLESAYRISYQEEVCFFSFTNINHGLISFQVSTSVSLQVFSRFLIVVVVFF